MLKVLVSARSRVVQSKKSGGELQKNGRWDRSGMKRPGRLAAAGPVYLMGGLVCKGLLFSADGEHIDAHDDGQIGGVDHQAGEIVVGMLK